MADRWLVLDRVRLAAGRLLGIPARLLLPVAIQAPLDAGLIPSEPSDVVAAAAATPSAAAPGAAATAHPTDTSETATQPRDGRASKRPAAAEAAAAPSPKAEGSFAAAAASPAAAVTTVAANDAADFLAALATAEPSAVFADRRAQQKAELKRRMEELELEISSHKHLRKHDDADRDGDGSRGNSRPGRPGSGCHPALGAAFYAHLPAAPASAPSTASATMAARMTAALAVSTLSSLLAPRASLSHTAHLPLALRHPPTRPHLRLHSPNATRAYLPLAAPAPPGPRPTVSQLFGRPARA